MLWCLCESYRAVLEEPVPDLHRESSSGTAGHIRVNYSGVDQSRKVGTHCRQMTAVCKPWKGKIKVFMQTSKNSTIN